MNQEDIEKLIKKVQEKAKDFGVKTESSRNSPKNATWRNDTKKSNEEDKKDWAPYFGYIRQDETSSGKYSDLSLVIFPGENEDSNNFLVALGVGSSGFAKEFDEALQPGLRRQFLPLLSSKENECFCKTSFTDIDTTIDNLSELEEFDGMIGKYGKLILAARHLCFSEDDENSDMKVLYAWLAQYALFRNWPKKSKKENVREAVTAGSSEQTNSSDNDLDEIKKLIKERHFIVLQGAPGTGKTFAATKLAEDYKSDNVFFEQFHAETSYSDFVYGITPSLKESKGVPSFEPKKGVLYRAIEQAINRKESGERILLIIDEINRANLAHVLGPVFYLFENNSSERKIKIAIGDKEIEELPDNIDVVATMNTADRSLAVVDFALRRRFTWYTLRPRILSKDKLEKDFEFYPKYFERFDRIFKWYATDEELNLQPGQSYFIAKNEEEMKHRIVYELMPLIKEYLNEGFLLKAKDSFADAFFEMVNKQLFE